MITVIADDLTGAAEIAGIGLQFGFQVKLIMYTGGRVTELPEQCDLLVYATDTRSMTEQDAVKEVTALAQSLKEMGCERIFKKIDSALRGYIIAETLAVMNCFDKKRALLIPQNPSKGRIIENGKYYICGVPLKETSFAHDPEFPAVATDVTYNLVTARMLSPGKAVRRNGVFIANASTQEEIQFQASSLDERVIPAGGADFFTAYLIAAGHQKKEIKKSFKGLGNNSAIIVLGSTARHPITEYDYIRRQNIPIHSMPRIAFYKEVTKRWTTKIKATYAEQGSLILHVNHPPVKGRDVALNLRKAMGKAVQTLLADRLPQELIIEGGATAFSILEQLNWSGFEVKEEVSPGVIRIVPTAYPDVTITLKPGSYSWGELFR